MLVLAGAASGLLMAAHDTTDARMQVGVPCCPRRGECGVRGGVRCRGSQLWGLFLQWREELTERAMQRQDELQREREDESKRRVPCNPRPLPSSGCTP
jgi:hypothetical protein